MLVALAILTACNNDSGALKDALANSPQASGIKIVAVSFNEDTGTLPQDEIEARGYDFITAVEGEPVVKLYGVRGTPSTFFINRQGKTVYKSTSSDLSNPKLALAVKEIIKP